MRQTLSAVLWRSSQGRPATFHKQLIGLFKAIRGFYFRAFQATALTIANLVQRCQFVFTELAQLFENGFGHVGSDFFTARQFCPQGREIQNFISGKTDITQGCFKLNHKDLMFYVSVEAADALGCLKNRDDYKTETKLNKESRFSARSAHFRTWTRLTARVLSARRRSSL